MLSPTTKRLALRLVDIVLLLLCKPQVLKLISPAAHFENRHFFRASPPKLYKLTVCGASYTTIVVIIIFERATSYFRVQFLT